MPTTFLADITNPLTEIEAEGLYKNERPITSAQAGTVSVGDREVINLCANNYLGLANHPDLITAAKSAMDDQGSPELGLRENTYRRVRSNPDHAHGT